MSCILILRTNLPLPFPVYTLKFNCLVLRERSIQHHHTRSLELLQVYRAPVCLQACIHNRDLPIGKRVLCTFRAASSIHGSYMINIHHLRCLVLIFIMTQWFKLFIASN